MRMDNKEKLGKIEKSISVLGEQMENCQLCPRVCKVDRRNGKIGFCNLSDKIKIYKYKLHHGEEPPISGKNGSGIIFFSGCTMKCVFCQNYPFSHKNEGYEISEKSLAKIILHLQNQGAHNINLVTGSHFLPEVLKGLKIAFENGLNIPIVYNSNGFEKVEIIKLLDGIIDIYLPDMKYTTESFAQKYSKTKKYFENSRTAILEMFKQVGHLQRDENGIATKGLLIRHLILPNDLSDTKNVLVFISNNIGNNTFISLMTQYLPIWDSRRYPELDRRINFRELDEVSSLVEKFQITNGWTQDFD